MNQNNEQTTIDIEESVPESMHPIFEAIVKYKTIIVYSVVGLLLAVGVGVGIQKYSEYTTKKAQNELGQVLLISEIGERAAALETFLAKAPAELMTTTRFELAAAYMELAQYDKATAQWDEIAKIHDQQISAVAGLGKARCQMLAGNPQQALVTLNALRDTAPATFGVAINRMIAAAADQAGDTQAALTAYQDLASSGMAPDQEFINHKINQLLAGLK